MSATFAFYAIPLSQDSSASFGFELLCVPLFDQVDNGDDALDRTVKTTNPLWKAVDAGTLNAWIAPFQPWRDTPVRLPSLSSAAGVRTVNFALAPGQSSATLKQRMRAYFGNNTKTANQNFNQTRDALGGNELAHLGYGLHHLHQASQTRAAAAQKQFSMMASNELSKVSIPMLRWVDAASRSSLLDAVYKSPSDADDDSVKVLRDANDKIRARAAYHRTSAFTGVRGYKQEQPLDPSDLNAAVHAALREQFLCSYLGFRTTWIAHDYKPDRGVHLIQVADLFDAGTPQNTPSVVFFLGDYTHPAAFEDVAPSNHEPFTASKGLFIPLDGSSENTYSTTCIDAEAQLTRDVVLQGSNSLAAPANQPPQKPDVVASPQLLNQQRAGSSQPTTTGVHFFASPNDLIPPPALIKNGSRDVATWPCLFLEDLWIGYRLDLKRREDTRFLSIHQQRKLYTLRDGSNVPSASAANAVWVEDFIDREQQDAGPDKPASTNIFTYNGFTRQQMEDYRIALNQPANSDSEPIHSFLSSVVDFIDPALKYYYAA